MLDRFSYRAINIAFLCLILLVFLYCYFVFQAKDAPVVCIHAKLLGRHCASCGLTRSFGALLHADAKRALILNYLSLKIFCFFALQLIARSAAIWLSYACKQISERLMIIDSLASLLLFLFCFKELVSQTYSMVFKLN